MGGGGIKLALVVFLVVESNCHQPPTLYVGMLRIDSFENGTPGTKIMGIRFTKSPLKPQFAPFSRWALGHVSYMYTKARRLLGERKGAGVHAVTRLDYISLFDFIPHRVASSQLSALCHGGQTTISTLALFSGYALICNDILDSRANFCFSLVE